jgi:ribosomal protein L35AE/L33A
LAPGKQWVQIDLEKPADVSAVVIWHYHAEGRVYHSVVVQVSDDPEFNKDVKTVFNNDYANALGFGAGKNLEYIDDYRGKAVAVKDAKGAPVRGRYVRLHSNGNTSNDQNHYIEVEVYGKEVK